VKCVVCGGKLGVTDGAPFTADGQPIYYRRRKCKRCGKAVYTAERVCEPISLNKFKKWETGD
jgi:transcriptional regulator NrdR family protein